MFRYKIEIIRVKRQKNDLPFGMVGVHYILCLLVLPSIHQASEHAFFTLAIVKL